MAQIPQSNSLGQGAEGEGAVRQTGSGPGSAPQKSGVRVGVGLGMEDPMMMFTAIFPTHHHGGNGPADGGLLTGPYYIYDAAGKKRVLSVSATGEATWTLV